MLIRTHLAITALAIILFFSHVSSKIVFILTALIVTFIPDIDHPISTLGQFKGFRFLQFFTKHRSFLHSFTFCILASLVLALFFPVVSFAFFLAYSLHLLADSFTVEGIKPFWPYPKKSTWRIRTGGKSETSIFVFFVLLDVLLLFYLIF